MVDGGREGQRGEMANAGDRQGVGTGLRVGVAVGRGGGADILGRRFCSAALSSQALAMTRAICAWLAWSCSIACPRVAISRAIDCSNCVNGATGRRRSGRRLPVRSEPEVLDIGTVFFIAFLIAICALLRRDKNFRTRNKREGIQLLIRRVHPRSRQLAVDGPGVQRWGRHFKEKPACTRCTGGAASCLLSGRIAD